MTEIDDRPIGAYLVRWCEHAGMVRVGPGAQTYPDPYVFSVGVQFRDGVAIVEGTHRPEGGIKVAYIWAIRALFQRLGMPLKMDRRRKWGVREVWDPKNLPDKLSDR
jgi:hypothetical protein